MNERRVQQILEQARKNARTGEVATEPEFNRLMKEYKLKKSRCKDEPKLKVSRRQRRLQATKKKINLTPKPKAHRWPRVRIKTSLGYKTL